MRWILLMSVIYTNFIFAESGKVLKVINGKDAYVLRKSEKIPLATDLLLETGDHILTKDAYAVVQIYPATQLSLSKNSEFTLSEYQIIENQQIVNSFSVIDFMRGLIRVQVFRDKDLEVEQKIQTKDVSFAVRGTEFEISLEDDKSVELDVFEGEVAVSSPHIHSFVPEIVKTNEGFRFDRVKTAFVRRKFSPRFKNHPGFEKSAELLKKWKERRKKVSQRKSDSEKQERRTSSKPRQGK